MWKPGEAEPSESHTPKTPRQENLNGPLDKKSPLPKKGGSSTKKRLSGATMGMRFMKRRMETQQADERRKSGAGTQQEDNSPVRRVVTASPKNNTPNNNEDDAMDIEQEEQPQNDNDEPFAKATPADMYGMQASVLGRRSFGGFNAATESAWKDSKDSAGNRLDDTPKQKVSDEELLERYQDLVQKRSESSKSIGNLNDKAKKRKKRR